jgi:NAD(P)-dependent dehydrogenase (short-subunit alcohol dehydrogenase family)
MKSADPQSLESIAQALAGQRALVTGANSGIGAGIARAMAAAGATVYPGFRAGG